MDTALPVRPSSVYLFKWLFIIVMNLVVFIPHLYMDRFYIEPVFKKSEATIQMAISTNTNAKQTALIQPNSHSELSMVLDESIEVKIPLFYREEYYSNTSGRSKPPVHKKKPEHLLNPIVLKAAERYQVDSALIKAVIMVESSFNQKATSRKGAKGLMQLMPRTAKILGVKDIFNPEQNINAGVRHLKNLLKRYKGNVKLALAAYHAGSRKVRKHRGVPPTKSTRSYIKKVLAYYQHYRGAISL